MLKYVVLTGIADRHYAALDDVVDRFYAILPCVVRANVNGSAVNARLVVHLFDCFRRSVSAADVELIENILGKVHALYRFHSSERARVVVAGNNVDFGMLLHNVFRNLHSFFRIIAGLPCNDHRIRAQLHDLILDTIRPLDDGFNVILGDNQHVAFTVKFFVDPLCGVLADDLSIGILVEW